MFSKAIKYFKADKNVESARNAKVKTIFFIVGFALFLYLINRFGIENILVNIRKTGWWLLPITGIWAFVYLLNAQAWSLVIKSFKHKISFKDIFSISLSGFAINYITPVVNLGGEPYKIMALKERLGLNGSVASVILYSMLHFLSSFVFWFLAIILAAVSLPLTNDLRLILAAAFLFTLAGVWFFYKRHKNGVFNSLLNLIKKLPFTAKLSEKMKLKEESLNKIDSQIIELYTKQRGTFFASLFLETFARIVASVEYIFILRAIGIDIGLEDAIYINAFSSLILNLFFFIPMGLGVREGSLFLIMGGLNITSAIGVYIGLVNRIREFFWILIGLLLIQFRGSKIKENELKILDAE
ncbi:MAG: flippase-like domain-containing protein [Chlorobi bacterium]|nr:flippase-like domain-containing protein [Chlorobiota bacterium]